MNIWLCFCLVVSALFPVLHCIPLHLHVGSKCTNTNAEGICMLEPNCPEAKEDVAMYGYHNLTRCGFDNFTEIVCCSIATERSSVAGSTRRRNSQKKSVQACRAYTNNFSDLGDFQITGGKAASLGEFPHMAALGLYSAPEDLYKFDCGGTLISNKHIVTAAHCLVEMEKKELKIVRMGVIEITPFIKAMDPKYDYKVKNVTVHPNYTKKGEINDIALVELDNEVKFSDYLRPACLHTKDDDPKEFVIIGWGELSPGGTRSSILQKATVTSVPFQDCNKRYVQAFNRSLPNTQICAADSRTDTENISDTCWGDSGGPLQMQKSKVPILVGITSYGQRICGTSFPTVYTKIYKYMDWIESIVWP